MELIIEPGQTIRLSTRLDGANLRVRVTTETPRRPGPKSLPRSTAVAADFHTPILNALQRGPLTSALLRSVIGGTAENKNAISWALVELQNAGSRRGKNLPKTGPVVKDGDEYRLR